MVVAVVTAVVYWYWGVRACVCACVRVCVCVCVCVWCRFCVLGRSPQTVPPCASLVLVAKRPCSARPRQALLRCISDVVAWRCKWRRNVGAGPHDDHFLKIET